MFPFIDIWVTPYGLLLFMQHTFANHFILWGS